uniref:GIY-YIG endonuclease n=1 Tax=Pyronema omphalodes TaxID=337075 RepID=A0A140IMY9_9PEZI|nr:GIY-YIG endonuclease [Pyronema omphalodes]AMO66547.1 GIY-YIG endonuclease [Pyronema omphalodes]
MTPNEVPIPVVTYSNVDTMKPEILKDNKKKSGIYMFVNKSTGDTYVGSSANLGRRFGDYFKFSYVQREMKSNNSRIYRALSKYGYSGFQLDILEYCDPKILREREQHYIDFLKPTYNILKIAGSFLGFNHSEDTKEKMRNSLPAGC